MWEPFWEDPERVIFSPWEASFVYNLEAAALFSVKHTKTAHPWNENIIAAVWWMPDEKVKLKWNHVSTNEINDKQYLPVTELLYFWRCYKISFYQGALFKKLFALGKNDCEPNPLTENVNKIASTPVSWEREDPELNFKNTTAESFMNVRCVLIPYPEPSLAFTL